MRDISCKLLSTQSIKDSKGIYKTPEVIETEIPILKIEDIYADEFYRANEQGYKPSLRLRVSLLNYDNQQELVYMNQVYTIIRTQETTADEITLICERKVKNVKKNQSR